MRRQLIFAICFIVLSLGGCNVQKMDGYIMEVNEDSLLIAEGATEEEAIKWLELTYEELIDSQPAPSLVAIQYEKVEDFQVGDYVQIILEGEIAASYPEQGKAKFIELIENKE